MTKILVIQGANLNALGKREPEFYGTTSAAELDAMIIAHAQKRDIDVEIFYTNTEGEAIDRIYQAVDAGLDGLLMNPAGFSYTGYALCDCVKAVAIPYVEVHISHVENRGIHSVVAKAAHAVLFGFGLHGYMLGLDGLLEIIRNR